MSFKKEIKIEKVFDATQAAEFFHTLGLAITWGSDDQFAEFGLPLSDFEKVKLTIKKEGSVFILKAKVKKIEPFSYDEKIPSEDQPQGKPSYKNLKKRMKGSFSELKKMLTQDTLPNAETVLRFLDESYLMITFPGMGDDQYQEYERTCLEFQKAFESGDIEAMRNSLAAVELRKKACHEQYK